MLLPLWEMYGLSGKSEANFKEFTSRLGIVDRGVTISLTSRNTQNLPSVYPSFISFILDELLLS